MALQDSPRPADPVDFSEWIPIFPLPNAVLLPKAILPLHIFEQRYRLMTTDVLSGPGVIAMALLSPGHEPKYHTLDAPIHQIVCVGRILRKERLQDGRYNILLQGVTRARICEENRHLKYRRAKLDPICPTSSPSEHDDRCRRELGRLLTREPLANLASQAGWVDLLNCPELAFSDLLDVLASVVLQNTNEKQEFLEEPDAGRRAERIRAVLSAFATIANEQEQAVKRPRSWPPVCIAN